MELTWSQVQARLVKIEAVRQKLQQEELHLCEWKPVPWPEQVRDDGPLVMA